MKVHIHKPHLPKGYEISLTGLNALLPNDEDVELDDDIVKEYEAKTGKKLADVLKSSSFTGKPKRVTKKKTDEEVENEDEN